jgi:hypothetical protein
VQLADGLVASIASDHGAVSSLSSSLSQAIEKGKHELDQRKMMIQFEDDDIEMAEKNKIEKAENK